MVVSACQPCTHPTVRAHPGAVRPLLHGSGGVALAHDSSRRARLAILAVLRAGRPAREHHRQSSRTHLECRHIAGAQRRTAADAPGQARETPRRWGCHGDVFGTPLAVAQSRGCAREARGHRSHRPRTIRTKTPPHEAHERLAAAPPRVERSAVGDKSPTQAAGPRLTHVLPASVPADRRVRGANFSAVAGSHGRPAVDGYACSRGSYVGSGYCCAHPFVTADDWNSKCHGSLR